MKKITLPKCHMHPSIPANTLCLDCKVPVCEECQIDSHINHSLIQLIIEGKKLQNIRVEIQNALGRVVEMTKKCLFSYNDGEKNAKDIEEIISKRFKIESVQKEASSKIDEFQSAQTRISEVLSAISKNDYETFSKHILDIKPYYDFSALLEEAEKWEKCYDNFSQNKKILQYFARSFNSNWVPGTFCTYCSTYICKTHCISCNKCKALFCSELCHNGVGEIVPYRCVACRTTGTPPPLSFCRQCSAKVCYLCGSTCNFCKLFYCSTCVKTCISCNDFVCRLCSYQCKAQTEAYHCLYCIDNGRKKDCCKSMPLRQEILIKPSYIYGIYQRKQYSTTVCNNLVVFLQYNAYYLSGTTFSCFNVVSNIQYPSLATLPGNITENSIIDVGINWIYSIGGATSNGLIQTAYKYSVRNNFWRITPSPEERINKPALCVMNMHYIYAFTDSVIFRLDVLEEEEGWNKILTMEAPLSSPLGILQCSPDTILKVTGNVLFSFNIQSKCIKKYTGEAKCVNPCRYSYLLWKSNLFYFNTSNGREKISLLQSQQPNDLCELKIIYYLQVLYNILLQQQKALCYGRVKQKRINNLVVEQ